MSRAKRLSKRIIALIVAGVFIVTVAVVCIGMQIAFVIADKVQCWHPDYGKIDIRPILEQNEISDSDYDTLYRQTGLTKLGIDRTLKAYGIDHIISIQSDFFAEHTVINDKFAPFICQDKIEKHVSYTALENGDIVITSSTHLSGWRMGHAGLVTDGASRAILQASAVGSLSSIGSMYDFNDRVNFMVFSPKLDTELKDEVAEYAINNLQGKVYDPTAGVFSSKNKVERTQCSHIVWYAYKQFGIDLDSDGGLVVTPNDIAHSPYLELVQVFGMDVDKLW